ncbi:hypothetical protein NST69_06035 [Paenibacillus sp. FSL P2-0089]|uniref:hypothetical protein n=1 Tax=Paenibacillus sp. FSL P2-0089 TaxID=2954526 RepID=UPI00315A2AEA
MKDDKKAPLDGRTAGVHPIPEGEPSPADGQSETDKLDEVVGAVLGNDPEVSAPGLSPDPEEKKHRKNP